MSKPTTDKMTSSGFVGYAIEFSRTGKSWDDAEYAFAGPTRWEPVQEFDPHTVEAEPAMTRSAGRPLAAA